MPTFKNLLSMRFGKLVAIKHLGRLPNGKKRNHYWDCRCDCGAVTAFNASYLLSGDSKSCGCLKNENMAMIGASTRTHGMSTQSTYQIWNSMIQRCTNPSRKDYQYYGAVGIRICRRWMTFENFLLDMGKRPPNKTIDRFPNNNGNYEPGNCRWATTKEQARNKGDNRQLTYRGESRCVAEWAELLNINVSTIESRLRRGWNIEKSLSHPIQFHRRYPHV